MKFYRLNVMDKDRGNLCYWFTNKTEAASAKAMEISENCREAYEVYIEEIEVPTDKAGFFIL